MEPEREPPLDLENAPTSRANGDYPPLVTYADTIRQLESVGSAGLIEHRVIDALVDAYRGYRRLIHRLSLEQGRPVVPAAPHAATRAAVIEVWDAVMVRGEVPIGPGAVPAGAPL